jgi:hypothetical protein
MYVGPLDTFMLCEKCHEREAMVHLTGNRQVDTVSGETSTEDFEHHFCESCASSSPLVNPALACGADAISEKLRVIGVSPERTRVRLVRTDTDVVPEEWSLLTSGLPSDYLTVGMEFGITCTPHELEHLKGNG